MIKIGKVINIEDENDGGRIKVELLPSDSRTEKDKIQYAFPLLPKMISVKPKVGEAVFILNADDNKDYSQRYYIGPIISQSQFIYKDTSIYGATATLDGGIKSPSSAITRDPNTNGVFGAPDDIAIYGRRNSDIILKDNDLLLRCGCKYTDSGDSTKIVFNNEASNRPAYIKLHFDDTNDDKKNSTASIVAHDINLLSTDGPKTYKLTDPNGLITDEEMQSILDTAHKLPYGDILVDFLEKLKRAFLNHTHPIGNLPPVPDGNIVDLEVNYSKQQMIDKILSKHIRIN